MTTEMSASKQLFPVHSHFHSAHLSSSYPSAYHTKVLNDVTKSRLDSEALAESWSQGSNLTDVIERSDIVKVISTTESTTAVQSTNSHTAVAPAPGDLPSLAWLQRGCILNIAPLDAEDTSVQSHEVIVSTAVDESCDEDRANDTSSPLSVSSVHLPLSTDNVSLSSSFNMSSASKQTLFQKLSGRQQLLFNGTISTSNYSDDVSNYLSASSGSTGSGGFQSLHQGHHSYSSILNRSHASVKSNSHYSGDTYFAPSRGAFSSLRSSDAGLYDMSGSRRPPKPAYSYTHLIFMAIESTLHKCMTVNEIYNWCETHFPYFKTAGAGWKNSLRHNLSINKCFKRIPRDGRGPGRGAYWTVESKERAQLLEAVKRNPWTALTLSNNHSTSLHQAGGSAHMRGTHRLSTYQLEASCYPPRLVTPTLVTAANSNSFVPSGPSATTPTPSPISAKCTTPTAVDEEDAEAVQYANLLKGLHPVTGHNSHHSVNQKGSSLSKSMNVESTKLSRQCHNYSSDTEINDAKLPSRRELPLLHKTMKKMLLGMKKCPTDDESDSQLTDRDMQGVLDLMNMQQSANTTDRGKCAECKENAAQGCESCLARGKRTPCYVTPAPYVDHEYARFQSILRPYTHNDVLVPDAPHNDRLENNDYSDDENLVSPPVKRPCRVPSTTKLSALSPDRRHSRRRARWLYKSISHQYEDSQVKTEIGYSSGDEDDDQTEPMSQPAGLADLSSSSSDIDDDDKCDKTAAQILVEFSRLRRFQQQSGYWTSNSSLEKSLSD